MADVALTGEEIRAEAPRLGFDLVGIVRAESLTPEGTRDAYQDQREGSWLG